MNVFISIQLLHSSQGLVGTSNYATYGASKLGEPDISFELEEYKEEESILIEDDSKKAKSSNVQAGFNLFKTFVGMGVLALPETFSHSGYVLGIVGSIFVGLVTIYCMVLIVEIVDELKDDKMTFSGLGARIMGRGGEVIVDICIVTIQFTICIAIVLFIITFMNNIFCANEVKQLCGTKDLYLLIVLAFILPMSFITNIHYFSYSSMIAIGCMLVGIFTTLYYDIKYLATEDISAALANKHHIENIPAFFGVSVYAFEGIGAVLNIRGSMQAPASFKKILVVEGIILVLLYSIFPTVSYLAFGSKLKDLVLFSLPVKEKFVMLVCLLYGVGLVLSFPLQLAPAIKIIEKIPCIRVYVNCNMNPKNRVENGFTCRRFSLKLVIIFFFLYIARIAPKITTYLNLAGSLFFTIISFIVPVIFYNKFYKKKIDFGTKSLNWSILFAGTILGTFGVIQSVKDTINQGSSQINPSTSIHIHEPTILQPAFFVQ
eukprot:TRINITY_DN10076_c0_g1_i4.p1 TRINITY_DN10076_c0_g1~~TRINITY_DN10076_c0_g1_i4.p1  ORF type:complete len:488 (+),score=132.98 TRINITY_DN10076_c0_g1_i4:140-1603(+)